MQFGDIILIIPSCALQEMRLQELAGTQAKIVEVIIYAGKVRGCWVRLPHEYLGDTEWYIPYSSIG